MILYDNHNRPLTYLRLAVTDRCNLRCFYCMPAEGIHYLPQKELLTYEEIVRLVTLLTTLGIRKVRLTGGEPFVRTDLMKLIHKLSEIPALDLHLTTNGVLTAPHLPALKAAGIASVNLSLDTLDEARFVQITRRSEFANTMATLRGLLEHDIPVKINAVVMDGKNTDDIIPLVELTRHDNVDVRFIEEMPFNGGERHYNRLPWTYTRIIEHIRQHYPSLHKVEDPENTTAYHYAIPGHRGRIGVIAAYSRTFCGTCNRIRITAQGGLKTCLYDNGVLDIKALMRAGATDDALRDALLLAFGSRAKDGFEAEATRAGHTPVHESMSTIGG